MAGAEQRLVGDDDVEADRDLVGVGLAGESLDQQVGHHLPLTTLAGVAGGAEGVGVALDRGVGGDALPDGEDRGEVGHRVGGGAQADVAVALGLAGAADDGGGVGGVDAAAELTDQGLGAEAGQQVGVTADLLIDDRAVLTGQAAGLPGDQERGVLIQAALAQRLAGAGQVGGQVLREPEVHLPAVGRLLAGQRDLGGDPAATQARGEPLGCLAGAHRVVEVDGEVGLPGGGCGLEPLELGDLLDAVGVGLDRVTDRAWAGEHQVARAAYAAGGEGLRDHVSSVSNRCSNDKPISTCREAGARSRQARPTGARAVSCHPVMPVVGSPTSRKVAQARRAAGRSTTARSTSIIS